MGGYGQEKILSWSFGVGDSRRASPAPEGVARPMVAWDTVPTSESGEKCLRYGTIVLLITAEGQSKGLVGPYDPNATDGRQSLFGGRAFILNETVCESERGTGQVEVYQRGLTYQDVLLIGGENQPTVEDFRKAFPDIREWPG